jgi:alanyl-tRNA synthetase
VKAADIRKTYLQWFEGQGHTIVRSSPLIPHNDPTLFFTNAGMVQFKDVFTGLEKRDDRRATTVQKCLRVSGKHNDLENVGRTPRHHTFFEMLGNFSFGDYFKEEAIPYAWELLTGTFAIDPNRLWVTIYEDDDEAFDIWRSKVNFPSERIQRLGAKDNFWSMGDTGPCGPCTEIHYDHGPAVSDDTRGPAGGSDRYVEIWNLVFMQFDQAADGTRTRLPRPSIDTGMGLERLAAVRQGVYSNYDTDLFQPIIASACRQAGHAYGHDADIDTALRVMSDHARATAFLVADGVMPSNEGRGYVLRRIMRRAIRFGVKIGLDKPFFHHLTETVAENFGAAYPELLDRQTFVREVVQSEEERFRRTIDRGMKLLDEQIGRVGQGGTLPGDLAFVLSDTYGFPLDLTEMIAAERGVGVDAPGYEAALGAQKARGRAAWKGSGEQAIAGLWHELADAHGATAFIGYAATEGTGAVVAAIAEEVDAEGTVSLVRTERLHEGQRGIVLLDRTPFYGESGGQAGDAGTLTAEGGAARVLDVTKASGLHLHKVVVTAGTVGEGDILSASVDDRRRDATRRNHTATHLLHAALRSVLGEHVSQKGSLVAADRLRFDFAHHKPVSVEEVSTIESMVQEQILRNIDVKTSIQSLEEAQSSGAMALFGEKYDAEVRVVSIPGFSLELCGGTHVRRTGDIGVFRILSEGGVAAGIRRIEAQTGHGALAWMRERESALIDASSALKTDPTRLSEAIARLKADLRDAERRAEAAESKIRAAEAAQAVGDAAEIGGVKVLIQQTDAADLRGAADTLRDELGTGVVILASARAGKALLLAAATRDLVGRVHCGKIIEGMAPHVGGRGGGRPDMAQAGGEQPEGLSAALDAGRSVLEAQLGV